MTIKIFIELQQLYLTQFFSLTTKYFQTSQLQFTVLSVKKNLKIFFFKHPFDAFFPGYWVFDFLMMKF